MSTPVLLVIHPPGPSRDLLLETAARLGFAVQVCDTGGEGLFAFRQRPPDTLVASLDLPDMEGLTLMTSVRDEAPDLSLVLLTARASVESAVAAIRLGVHDYLREPIDAEKLRALLTDRFDDALRRRVRLFPAERSQRRLVSRHDWPLRADAEAVPHVADDGAARSHCPGHR